MPVQRSCDPDANAVRLNLAAGQQLRYTVKHDDSVTFTLRDPTGNVLLSSDSPARDRIWPGDAEVPDQGSVTHTLGMQFGEAGELRWTVEQLDDGGAVIRVVKDCTYRNPSGTDDHFDTLRLFLRRQA
jgi:hypothetical protein